jgi:hypothetical protein
MTQSVEFGFATVEIGLENPGIAFPAPLGFSFCGGLEASNQAVVE